MSSGSARELSEIRVESASSRATPAFVNMSPRRAAAVHGTNSRFSTPSSGSCGPRSPRNVKRPGCSMSTGSISTTEEPTPSPARGYRTERCSGWPDHLQLYRVSWVVTRLLDQLPARSVRLAAIEESAEHSRPIPLGTGDAAGPHRRAIGVGIVQGNTTTPPPPCSRQQQPSCPLGVRPYSRTAKRLLKRSLPTCASLPVNLERPTPAVLAFVWDHLDRGRRHQGETSHSLAIRSPASPRLAMLAGSPFCRPDLPKCPSSSASGASSRSTCAAMRRRGSPCRTRSSNSEASTDCRRCEGSKLLDRNVHPIWRSRRSTVTALSNMKCRKVLDQGLVVTPVVVEHVSQGQDDRMGGPA